MLLILGALKIELDNFIRSTSISSKVCSYGTTIHTGEIAGRDVCIAVTGMGRDNAEKAVASILAQKEVREAESIDVLITGLCGGTNKDIGTGDLVVYNKVVDISHAGHVKDSRSGRKPDQYGTLHLSGKKVPGMIRHVTCGCTGHLVTSPEEKKVLYNKYMVDVIDMESYQLARILIKNGLPLERITCVRAVSDTAEEVLHPCFSTGTPGRTILGIIKSLFAPFFFRKQARANIHMAGNIRKACKRLDKTIIKYALQH